MHLTYFFINFPYFIFPSLSNKHKTSGTTVPTWLCTSVEWFQSHRYYTIIIQWQLTSLAAIANYAGRFKLSSPSSNKSTKLTQQYLACSRTNATNKYPVLWIWIFCHLLNAASSPSFLQKGCYQNPNFCPSGYDELSC